MSAPHLPNDLRQWPRDPYQVLGVAVQCSPLEARRAYTRLIKHFKPEQFPEHFRLIREAYDTVKRNAQFFGSFHQEPAAPPTETSPAPSEPAKRPKLDGAPAPSAPVAAMPETLETLWAKACDGQEEQAYAQLRQMYDANPMASEIAARLYALLLANPELDPPRTPCDWLARGALWEGPWGPCRQLYRREIDDHPEEAMRDRFIHLLDSVSPARNVLDLVGWRWEALARLGRQETMSNDLARLAERLERADEEGYVRVLLKAADHMAWQRTVRFGELCQEIDSHVHIHSLMGEELSRLDFLRELARSWHLFQFSLKKLGTNIPLLDAVPMSWTSPFENRHRILSHCREVAEKPEAALKQLDSVQRQAPLLAAHLGQTLSWLWQAPPDSRDQSDINTVIEEHFRGIDQPVANSHYNFYRRHLLRLCVTEMIAPETVANTLMANGESFAVQMILDDWPLRTVCLAHRLVWA